MAKGKDVATAGILEFPVGAVNASEYACRRADVYVTNERQAIAMKMLLGQLISQRATIRGHDGDIPVNSPARALLWMLERVADGSEQCGIVLPK